MIAALMIATLVATLLVNLTGLALAAKRFIPNYFLAKVASPVLLCLGMFCLEHSIGLGDLAWVGLPLTACSLGLIWKERQFLLANLGPELLFLGGFCYALLWGLCFPDIDGHSEKLGDLTFIRDYLSGTRLPPPDYWLPPFRFDVYYGFQFYSSALLGRILHLDAGTTYRISLCVIIGLTITAAGGAVFRLSGGRKRSLFALAAFVFGGTGASLLVRFFQTPVLLGDGMRFIGNFPSAGKAISGLGSWLVAASHIPAKNAMLLPAETFGYLVYLGDHHPPMSGFLLLTLALLCVVIADKEDELKIAPAVLAATIPAVVAADAWNLPLQVLLVTGWVMGRTLKGTAVPWKPLAVGLGGGFLLVLPFLQSVGLHLLDYRVQLRLVPGPEHTPPLLGLIVWVPFLLLLGAAALSARNGNDSLRWCLFWSLLLILSELFYVDDFYSGSDNRFNSTLKWWPWIMAGMVLTLGPLALTARKRVSRWGALLALSMTACFAVSLGKYMIRTPKPHMGQVDGAAWLRSDPTEKAILEFLKNQRPGIVLQRLEAEAFTFSPGMVIHSGQQAFLGWPDHEKLWRGARVDIGQRRMQVQQFYAGDLPESAAWLRENRIDHVLWLKGEAQLPPGTHEKIEGQIHDFYFWREYYREENSRAGVWSRREFPLTTISNKN